MTQRVNPLKNKLRGYFMFHRRALTLLSGEGGKKLSPTEFTIYITCITIADWDKKRADTTYGSFKCTNWQIGDRVGRDETTASRAINKLVKLNLLQRQEGGRIRVFKYEMFDRTNASKFTREETENMVAGLQGNLAPAQRQVASTQSPFTKGYYQGQTKNLAPMQPSSPKAFNFPYKGEFKINNEYEYKSSKEYIYRLKQNIGNNWSSNDPTIKLMVSEYNRLADKLTEYEINNGILK